jgi:hypothetical protein
VLQAVPSVQETGNISSHWLSFLLSQILIEVELSPEVKGSRQPKSRGVRNVSNCPNLARTSAIQVRFSLNFAVVFDFIYFRFRPSKEKLIGIVLLNWRNAAIFFPSFIMCIAYWRSESVRVLRQCSSKCKKANEIITGN